MSTDIISNKVYQVTTDNKNKDLFGIQLKLDLTFTFTLNNVDCLISEVKSSEFLAGQQIDKHRKYYKLLILDPPVTVIEKCKEAEAYCCSNKPLTGNRKLNVISPLKITNQYYQKDRTYYLRLTVTSNDMIKDGITSFTAQQLQFNISCLNRYSNNVYLLDQITSCVVDSNQD
jgi:hypothetical protein